MNDKVISTILKYRMIPYGSKVLVAFSGGSDSMALLHILNSEKEKLGITLEAAHVNHCLRGGDSEHDEAFAREACTKLGITLHVLRADVAAMAKESGEGLEETGRRIRYDFFASLGGDFLIATAHNLNDRAETFLFNFTRGSSLKGLCSIPPVRGSIIRPLIECSKEEIIDYCVKNRIEYCTDKTNADVHYSRNRIRHNVIPELSKINTGFTQSANRCINLLNADEEFLTGLSEELIQSAREKDGWNINILYTAAPSLRFRALASITASETGEFPDNAELEYINVLITDYTENKEGKSIDIHGGKAITGSGLLRFVKDISFAVPEETELKEGTAEFGSYLITCKIMPYTNCSQTVLKETYNYIADCDKICGKPVIGVRRQGDRLSLAGRGISKPLRKLQNEKGILPQTRDSLPVIRDDGGPLIAHLCGTDARVAVTAETKKILAVRIEGKPKNDK